MAVMMEGLGAWRALRCQRLWSQGCWCWAEFRTLGVSQLVREGKDTEAVVRRGSEGQRRKLEARGTRAEIQGRPSLEEYPLGMGRARRPKLSPNCPD